MKREWWIPERKKTPPVWRWYIFKRDNEPYVIAPQSADSVSKAAIRADQLFPRLGICGYRASRYRNRPNEYLSECGFTIYRWNSTITDYDGEYTYTGSVNLALDA